MRLETRSLTKRFPAVTALEDVSLTFEPGQVHGIVGENGAGKSTLMRLLAGINEPTSGEILIDGQPAHLHSTHDAARRGIAMIHQELNLVDELTVGENIMLGREPRRNIFLDRAALRTSATEALKQVNANLDPDTRLGDLSIASQQLVEIAKAVSLDAELIIMDEPTAVLSERETESLMSLVRELKERGATILFISHHLSEVAAICDQVTVLRDGRWIATLPASSVTPQSLATLMVGREMEDVYPPKLGAVQDSLEAVPAAPRLKVEGNVAFEVAKGEILGIAGLVGSGRTELAEAIVGLRPGVKVLRDGRELSIRGPFDAMRNGIAYVSEDRKGAGLVLPMDVRDNIVLANIRAYANPLLNKSSAHRAANSWIEKLGIRVADASAQVGTLSGGNQPKVAVAKWLDTGPEVLILDEPTRGIDVGAKREMYALIHDLAAQGMACVVISSEMTELIGLCHRILVLKEGRLAGELSGDDLTEERIMHMAAGVAG
jgi:ribose transport system ATP-binding protein